jgi:predicted acylesterase/phospholipase RssA
MAKSRVGLLLLLAAALAPACNGSRLYVNEELTEYVDVLPSRSFFGGSKRPCVPASLAKSRDLIDLCGKPGAHMPVPADHVREAEALLHAVAAARQPAGARPYTFLALSSGGLQGAFGVGVLNGWTKSGARPAFDVVTGVSVGSLIATHAFLGPRYDEFLRETLVGIERREVFVRRPLIAALCCDSVYSPEKLARRIKEAITPELLGEVARAHAEGRRLYLGTTNLDKQGLVLWDMGAIASRGTPEALALYRDVVLASASIPGVFPPVELHIEVDGKHYTELHADGAASDQAVFRRFLVADLNRAAGTPGPWAPPGSRLYIINNGKLYPDPTCVRRKTLRLVATASSSLLYNKTRDEMTRMFMECLTTGTDFQLARVPDEVRLGSSGLRMTPEDQERLYAVGYEIGLGAATGKGWLDLPPGVEAWDQALPRSGTRFATPGEACEGAEAVPGHSDR